MPITNCKLKRLTPEVLELAENCATTLEISQKLNLSISTVKKILEMNKFIIQRKISDCKSRRLEAEILELINKDMPINKICEKLDLTKGTIKKVAKANGIDIDGIIKSGKLKQKKERNEAIYKMLLEGSKYQDIADKMEITKARVEKVAKTYNYRRWGENKKKFKAIIDDIKNDIKSGLSYEKVVKKHNLNNEKQYSRLHYWGLPNVRKEYANKRNENIGVEYKSGKKAIEITKSKEPVINQPQGLKSLSYVYSICTKQGIYKYPKVGRRIDGGSSEDFSILRLIKYLRETKKLSFEEIANHLNDKKYRTVCGKIFNWANVRFKYKDALKEGL